MHNVAIFTDNQAAIWSITKAKWRLGAYTLEKIAEQVQRLQDRGRSVVVRWIPVNLGITGNEIADKAVKESAGWRDDARKSKPADTPSRLYSTKTTLKICILYKQRERRWLNEKRRLKAEQHIGTHQSPLRGYFSFKKALVNGRARW